MKIPCLVSIERANVKHYTCPVNLAEILVGGDVVNHPSKQHLFELLFILTGDQRASQTKSDKLNINPS